MGNDNFKILFLVCQAFDLLKQSLLQEKESLPTLLHYPHHPHYRHYPHHRHYPHYPPEHESCLKTRGVNFTIYLQQSNPLVQIVTSKAQTPKRAPPSDSPPPYESPPDYNSLPPEV